MKTSCEKADVLIWVRDEALIEAISSILGDEGMKIQAVFNGHDMFKLLDECQPRTVILESGLPKVFGLEAHEIIRRIDRFRGVKVILLYSNASDLNANMNFIYRPDEYVESDHIHDLLISKIRRFMPQGSTIAGEYNPAADKTEEHETPVHKEARRLAKIIVSDIALYNRDKVEKGLEEGTFYDLLKEEIEKGRTFYNSRISPEILAATNYFDEALEDLIERGRPF